MPNILLVEDDEIMLKAIKSILVKEGYKVFTAKDGKEAFELINTVTFGILITDLMLPHTSGLEVVSKIRDQDSSKNIGIIVVSAVGNQETITEAFQLGADEYLKKPIIATKLLLTIKKLITDKNIKRQF